MKEIARRIIRTAFAGRTDKGGAPYIEHLERVSENAKHFFKGTEYLEQVETIALLHDLLEDCPEWTKAHLDAIFGSINITSAVDRLTRRKGQMYDMYITNINNDRFARAVKLADLQDNMDITRLPEVTEKDLERIKTYHQAYTFLLGQNPAYLCK